MKSNLIEVSVKIYAETEKAILVSDDDKKKIWLPKSQIEIYLEKGGIATITGPEWLFLDKGLI
jgi:hypothetical protein